MAVLFFAGAASSCSREPDLVPRLILEGEPVGRDFYLHAPYVAVVKITKSAIIGSPRPIFRGGPKDLTLVRYDGIVENAIRGRFPGPVTSFYFFSNAGQKHPYDLRPGERYIVSLRKEGEVFRSWSDATQLKIEVDSGSHNQKDLPLDLGVEAAIAYILIMPGGDFPRDEYHLGGYQWELVKSTDYLIAVPQYSYGLLKKVQQDGDPGVRRTACTAAAMVFQVLEKCIPPGDPDPAVRPSSQETVEFLQKSPSTVLPDRWSGYLLEMLEIYADDARPEIRTAACAALKKIAPERKVAVCR
jgi:hypothetical protein